MEVGLRKVCRLCLKACDNFRLLETSHYITFHLLLLDLNLDVSHAPVACSSCEENLKKCYDFKSACLNMENTLVAFANTREGFLIDLRELYLSHNKDLDTFPVDDNVCRFCLGLARQGSFVCLNDEQLDILLMKTMLHSYFPELNLTCTQEIISCALCYKFLENYCAFINNCLMVEEKIKTYCEVNGISIIDLMALNSVLCAVSGNTFGNQAISNSAGSIEDNKDGIVKTVKTEAIESSFKIKEELCVKEMSDEVKIATECPQFIKIEEKFGERTQGISVGNHVDNVQDYPGIKIKQENCDSEMTEGSCSGYNSAGFTWQSETGTTMVGKKEIELETHKCPLCVYQTEHENDLQIHMLIHKTALGVTENECKKCNFKAIDTNGLLIHMLSHNDSSDAAKNQCKPEASSKDKVRTSKHNSNSVYKCDSCSYQSNRKDQLRRHMLVHKSTYELTMYKCEQCTYQVSRKDQLRRHMLVHKSTSELTMYKCEVCSYQVSRKDHLRQHILIHKSDADVPLYKCPECTYSSKHKNNLHKHTLTHRTSAEVPIYMCEVCGFQTKRKQSARLHMLTHKSASEVPMHKCELCEYQSKRKRDVTSHMLTHKSASEVTMHKCELCPFQTKRKKNLYRHMLVHKSPSEVTMYKCEMCQYQTMRPKNLERHTNTHKKLVDMVVLPGESRAK